MASLGFIRLGISSISGRGLSKSSGNQLYVAKSGKPKKEKVENGNAKIPFSLIQEIRKLAEDGMKRSEIFNTRASEFMSYPYMVKILDGDCRVWS